MIASSLGFTFASGVVIAAAIPVYKTLLSAFGGGLLGHATLWAYIGIVGGTAGGLLTAPFLMKSLQPLDVPAVRGRVLQSKVLQRLDHDGISVVRSHQPGT